MKHVATFMRTDEPTPGGGDYSVIYFLDEGWKPVEEKDATWCMIQELKSDGTFVNETIGRYSFSGAWANRG